MTGRTALLYLTPLLCAIACDPRREADKREKTRTPAEVTSTLLDDVSPLDTASALPLPGKQEPWDPSSCVALPERERGASFSELRLEGACDFEHHGAATCQARGDDYYAILRRTLSDGTDLELYVNVEYYTGPGTYDRKVEVLALVRRGMSLYRWSNNHASVTLGFGQGGMSTNDRMAEQAQAGTPTLVQLAPTNLDAEPGTPTRGTIRLSGFIGCVMKRPPR